MAGQPRWEMACAAVTVPGYLRLSNVCAQLGIVTKHPHKSVICPSIFVYGVCTMWLAWWREEDNCGRGEVPGNRFLDHFRPEISHRYTF